MRAGKTSAQSEALVAWLQTVVPTAPFTIDDAKALYEMIRAMSKDACIDVHATDGRFTHVHVLVQTPDGAVVEKIISVR
jgi:REP element-mobilizing transposase RayT